MRVTHIGVVVPAKNEADLLPACLAALDESAAHVRIPVTVVVVLDGCSDQSAAVLDSAAKSLRNIALISLVIQAHSVGAARQAGMRALLTSQRADNLWLATTDADSVVPPHWFSAQMGHANDGARVVVGTIMVTDWHEHSPMVRERAIADYTATHHRHVHGANLSFAADAYLVAGGFTSQCSDEDVTLVKAFTAAGEPIAWALDLAVNTSARRRARAPSGFANYLIRLDSQLRVSATGGPL